MKSHVTLIASLVLISTLMTSCSMSKSEHETGANGNNSKAAVETAQASSSTPAPTEAIDEKAAKLELEAQELAKYNAYVDLNNAMTGRLQDVLNDYFEEFGYEAKPVIDKYFSATMLSLSESGEKTMQTAFAAAADKPSFGKLDAQVSLLEPLLTELLAALAEAHEYYEIKGYVDDQFAGSKTMHTRIVKAAAAYEEASGEFFSLLGKMGDERTRNSLQEYKDNGQDLNYTVMLFLLDAEGLATEMDDQGILADNILELDMAKFKAKYAVLTEDLKLLMEYAADETRVVSEGFSSHSLERYVDAAKKVKVSGAEIIERVNKKQRVEDFYLKSSFFRENQSGTPENFSKSLSELIAEYNQLQ